MKKELDFRDQLTSEQLLKRFKNQFELVRYAIQLAENSIRSGREPDIATDSQNVAYMILAEIAAHKEKFVEIPKEEAPAPQAKEQSFAEEARSFKEDKKERKSKAKAARF